MEQLKIEMPGTTLTMPISDVLARMAANEGCDGDPWDQMQIASEYIDDLENRLGNIQSIVNGEASTYVPDPTLEKTENVCHLANVCNSKGRPEICGTGNHNRNNCGNFTPNDEPNPLNGFYADFPVFYPLSDITHCVRCSVSVISFDHRVVDHISQCPKCGQSYVM